MGKRLIERFKNYTSDLNQGFKVAFDNNLVVSIAFFDHNCEEMFDENNKIIETMKEPIFTFNQADLCVFNQVTDENMTEKFCSDMEGYSEYEGQVIMIEPKDLAKVMYDVSNYKTV